MMSLASLFNVPDPQNEASFLEFSFSNADQHGIVTNAIALQRGVEIQRYVIDPIPMFDPGVWLRNHQQWHNYINGVLGISGVDLTSVDFNNAEEAASWTRLHASEHQQWSNVLGTD